MQSALRERTSRPPGRVASTPSKTRKRVPLHHLTATNAAVLMIAITAMSCCLCGVAALIARYVLQRTTLSAANHFPGEAAERVVLVATPPAVPAMTAVPAATLAAQTIPPPRLRRAAPPPPSAAATVPLPAAATAPPPPLPAAAAAAAAAAAPLTAAQIAEQERRMKAVRGAVEHSWANYKTYAWGADGLHPLTASPANEGFDHAVTMVDSLDTLWIVGMRAEFDEAVAWIAANLPGKISSLRPGVSAFETTIRSLGGLEAAHALSGDAALLAVAKQLGDRLVRNVRPETGVASYRLSGANGGSGCHTLAESGTNQLEFAYLSTATGDRKYVTASDRFTKWLRAHKPSVDGLWPNCFERDNGGLLTMGADGDSFYEYLLKRWLQGGKKDKALWEMYNDAVDGMEMHLVVVGADGLTYLQNARATRKYGDPHANFTVVGDPSMEHLTCFVPGWLALGAQHQSDAARKSHHLALAASLATTCWQMYARQPTGIAPERVKHMDMSLSQTDTREYILRPEAAESFFILHQLTGKSMYREWGWTMFQSFEKHLRVEHGYAALRDVRSASSGYLDRMESFWIAETLKYLYMLQEVEPTIPLDKWVLNTEAHPFPLPFI